MARKALIVFALLLVAAFCFVASAQDPQANKQGGGGGPLRPRQYYPPGHGGYYPPGNGWYPYGPYPGHHGGYPPHCRWGCCHRGHYGECRRCCG
ncbi:hypothetical protein E2562_011045 [Oryza meyeriana var. granulata]|uniref:Glycine-rich protein n=1 Tax=Oryza meyeriana var. granulata TaxID=110450 RepID=A0A6G1EWC8_9ORYZ|nr:hypothetical protein E2562_011045 [Oryza meyeriana var. granulata]